MTIRMTESEALKSRTIQLNRYEMVKDSQNVHVKQVEKLNHASISSPTCYVVPDEIKVMK